MVIASSTLATFQAAARASGAELVQSQKKVDSLQKELQRARKEAEEANRKALEATKKLENVQRQYREDQKRDASVNTPVATTPNGTAVAWTPEAEQKMQIIKDHKITLERMIKDYQETMKWFDTNMSPAGAGVAAGPVGGNARRSLGQALADANLRSKVTQEKHLLLPRRQQPRRPPRPPGLVSLPTGS